MLNDKRPVDVVVFERRNKGRYWLLVDVLPLGREEALVACFREPDDIVGAKVPDGEEVEQAEPALVLFDPEFAARFLESEAEDLRLAVADGAWASERARALRSSRLIWRP